MFWVRVFRGDDETRLVAGGDLDFAAQHEMLEAVNEALNEPAAPKVVVDLREVAYIDSTGLHAGVVTPWRRAHDARIGFRLLAGPTVRHLVELSGLASYLEMDTPE